MEKKTIWLNHWFSTAYNIVNLIKEDDRFDFHIIGTNENEVSVLKGACDEWYSEPASCTEKEYIDFCLEFCRVHAIDVFMPHRHFLSVSKYKQEFEKIGVKVLVDEYEKVSMLTSKEKSYDYFLNCPYVKVPEHKVVTNAAEFADAYAELESKYKQVCIKFVKDEGGKSYRLIDNSRKGYYALFKKQNTRMTYDAIFEALSEKEEIAPLMVMPYLDGDEISIDCLRTANGNIMVPRVKSTTRYEQIKYDNEILDVTSEILDMLELEAPCNVQYKYRDGVPYFLEINTRMSGGTHMSCAASGVNIPNIAINKLLGVNRNWKLNRRECQVSQVEIPVVLE